MIVGNSIKLQTTKPPVVVEFSPNASRITAAVVKGSPSSVFPYMFNNEYYLETITFEDASNVTSIGAHAFDNCAKLTSYALPPRLESIGERAFYGADNVVLTSNVFPSSLVSIGSYAFYECAKMLGATYPRAKLDLSNTQITRLETNTFYAAHVTEMDLPSTLHYIALRVFGSTPEIVTLTCRAVTPPTLASSSVFNSRLTNIYVPSASVDTYKTATNWSTYASIISAIPT